MRFETARIVLASSSPSRLALLRGAGLEGLESCAHGVDESAVKAGFADGSAALAATLAEQKALSISREDKEAYVIGADQVLDIDGEAHDKPTDMKAAQALLLKLRGRAHTLYGGAALARGGKLVWQHASAARLVMRDFSDAFLDAYLARTGEDVLASAGAYCLEGDGAHLFAQIEGDYFDILGLPLLPLLTALRAEGALLT